MEIIRIKLKGSSTKKIPSPKSHILDSNGVWYSPVWSEGPKNHLNLKVWSQILLSRGAAPKTSREGAM